MRRSRTLLGCAAVLVLTGLLAIGGGSARSRQDGTPAPRMRVDYTYSASVSYETLNDDSEIAFHVTRAEDEAEAIALHERYVRAVSAWQGWGTMQEMSFPPYGDESTALGSTSDELADDLRFVMLFIRDGEFLFRVETWGSDPVGVMVMAATMVPSDPAGEPRDEGTDDLRVLLPTLQEMPTGYVVELVDGTPQA